MKLFSTKIKELILATESKTRIEILEKYKLNFKVKKHSVDEGKVKRKYSYLPPRELVVKLAKEKAYSFKDIKNIIVIAADQILVINNSILSKAKTFKEAKRNLNLLQNKKHRLISAIYIIKRGKFYWCCVKEAVIEMRKLASYEINSYLKNNKQIYLTTVGGYQIENDILNCLKVEKGDEETIKGFPIKNIIPFLKKEIL